MKHGKVRRLDALASDGVERVNDKSPPTAFLIWKAGANPTDHGPAIFSERSAGLLLEEQKTRGNRYSMDVDHLSLNDQAPIENRKAVGFFSLEVRDGDLWACDCEWTDAVRAGLTKDPPEWKYFSPAYDVDKETNEVVSFVNCALTNNPATWSVTALASRGATRKSMKYADAMAALASDDADKKAAAMAAIKAAFGEDQDDEDGADDADKKSTVKAAEDDEDGDDSGSSDAPADAPADGGAGAAAPAAAPADGAAADEDKPSKEEKKSMKKTTAVGVAASRLLAEHDAELQRMKKELDGFKAEAEAKERKRMIAGRVMSPELARKLASKPLSLVKEICETLPIKSPKDLAAAERVAATRGQDGNGAVRTSRLAPEERAELDARMGLATRKDAIRREGNAVSYGVLTPDEARARLAANAKKEGAK